MPETVVQGQLVTVDVTALAAGGDAVARLDDGRVVFVSNAVPGDRVEARLLHLKKDHAFAQVHHLVEASAHRVVPACPVADRCGSCQWQQVDYPFQLEAKRNQVIEALERLGGFTQPPVEPVLAQARPLGYRNKSTFPVGRNARGEVVVGYYRKDSHQIVPLEACPVQDERLDPLLRSVRDLIEEQNWSVYDERQQGGLVRHIVLRVGERTGQMLLTFVVNGSTLPLVRPAATRLMKQFPNLKGVCLNINTAPGNTILGHQTRTVAGEGFIEDVLAGFRFRIGPETFFQICTSQAERLVELVVRAAAVGPGDRVIDAYCGIGTLSLPLGQTGAQVTGIEVHEGSVQAALANAERAASHCTFVAGSVETCLPGLAADVIVIDPPRKGCAPEVIEAIATAAPRRVVYVSCNPATLARDLRLLAAGGYSLLQVQPVDMFSQTHHVEVVATLVKKDTP